MSTYSTCLLTSSGEHGGILSQQLRPVMIAWRRKVNEGLFCHER